MSDYSFFAVVDEAGAPMSVHAHKDHAPEGGVPITEEQAIAISAARRVPKIEAAEITDQSDTTIVLRMMAEKMAAMEAELEAIKKTNVVVAVDKD